MGLFADDTRFLSRWALTVNGVPPLLLSSGKVDYYAATFFLRNPLAGDLGYDEVSIKRDRFVGDGMQEHIVVQNHAARALRLNHARSLPSRGAPRHGGGAARGFSASARAYFAGGT